MYHNQKYIIIIISIIVQLLSLNNKNHAQTLSDSLISINSDNTKSDSLNLKPSKAPIIVFGIVGVILGGVIGDSIDPPKKSAGDEIVIKFSNARAVGMVLGSILGSYVGYRLAKGQVEQKKKRLKDNAADKTATLKVEKK